MCSGIWDRIDTLSKRSFMDVSFLLSVGVTLDCGDMNNENKEMEMEAGFGFWGAE